MYEAYIMAVVSASPNGTCEVTTSFEPSHPVIFESIELIAFPAAVDRVWFRYGLDTGLAKFAQSGLLNIRRQEGAAHTPRRDL